MLPNSALPFSKLTVPAEDRLPAEVVRIVDSAMTTLFSKFANY